MRAILAGGHPTGALEPALAGIRAPGLYLTVEAALTNRTCGAVKWDSRCSTRLTAVQSARKSCIFVEGIKS